MKTMWRDARISGDHPGIDCEDAMHGKTHCVLDAARSRVQTFVDLFCLRWPVLHPHFKRQSLQACDEKSQEALDKGNEGN